MKTVYENEDLVKDKGGFEFILRTKKKVAGKKSKPHAKGLIDYIRTDFISLELFKAYVYVDELSKSHILIFNKFAEAERHMLVITKKQENQSDPLNAEDFYAALKVAKSLDCFFFYNGGYFSGGSRNHKHIQLMPHSTIDGKGFIPLELAAISYLKESGDTKDTF